MGWARELFAGKPAVAVPLLGSLHLDGSELRLSWGVHTHAEQDFVVFIFRWQRCILRPRVQSIRDANIIVWITDGQLLWLRTE